MKMTNLALVAATLAFAGTAYSSELYWYAKDNGDVTQSSNWMNSPVVNLSTDSMWWSGGDRANGTYTVDNVDFSNVSSDVVIPEIHVYNSIADEYVLKFLNPATFGKLYIGDGCKSWVRNHGRLQLNDAYVVNGNMYLGAKADDQLFTGILELPEGGSINVVGTSYIAEAASSTGRVDIAGGTFTSAETHIGQDGVGIVNMTSGTFNANGDLHLAVNNAASEGYLNVSGGTLAILYDLKVAHKEGSSAVAVISGDSVVTLKNFRIGNGANTTGALTISSSETVHATGNFAIANGNGSKGTVVVSGGSVEADGPLWLARADDSGANAVASLAVTNGTLKAASMQNGYSAGSVSTVTVGPGGLVDITGTAQLAWGGGIKGEIDVDGGTFKASQLDMGYYANNGSVNSKAAVAVSHGGVLDVAGDVLFGNLQGDKSDPNTLTLSEGGTAVVSRVYWKSGKTQNTGDKLVFDGGVLKARAANAEFISKSDSLTVEVTAKGGEIYSDYAATVKAALTGTGTLVKSGSGTMTLESAPTCGIRIEGGSVVFPDGSTLQGKVTIGSGASMTYNSSVAFSGGIELEEGATLVYDKSDYVSGAAYTLPDVTLPSGANISDYVVVYVGRRASVVFAQDGTSVTITDSSDYTSGVETRWIGGHGHCSGTVEIGGVALKDSDNNDMTDQSQGNSWVNPANWTLGVPSVNDTAVFLTSAVIDCRDRVGRDCGGYEFASLSIKNGAIVTVRADYETNNYYVPTLKPRSVDEDCDGTLTLVRCNVSTAEGCPINFPEGLTVVAKTTQTSGSSNRGKIAGQNGASITINGTLNCSEGYPEIGNHVVVNGELVGSAELWLTATGTDSATFATFNGDTRGFSGTFYADGNVTIGSDKFGGMDATWRLRGDIAVAISTGTLTFGNLVMDGNAKRVILTSNEEIKDLVFEVGAGQITGLKYLDINSCADVTIRKVAYSDDNPGIFEYAGYGFPKFDVIAGSFMFRDDSSNASAYGKIGEKYVMIDEISVAPGATLSGTNYADIAIASLRVEGSVAGPGTELTNVTTANVDGAKVVIDDSSALTAGMKYDLITANTLSGTPEVYAVDSEGNHVAASNGKPKNWWLAKARNNVLRLAEGNPNAGLAIIFR